MSAVDVWLNPLRTAVPEIDATGWSQLADLDARLDQLAAGAPEPDAGQAVRSGWLLHVRRSLADAGHTCLERHPLAEALAQFVCGFRDLNLRDATGLGHGALLGRAAEPTRTAWLTRLAAGDLVGIAATERNGGSRVQEITTGPCRSAHTGGPSPARRCGCPGWWRHPALWCSSATPTRTSLPRSSTPARRACAASRSHPPGWPAGPGASYTSER